MTFKLTWTPVIQLLDMGEYSPALSGESIPVCVNPPQEIIEERWRLLNQFSERYAEYQRVLRAKEKPENAVELAQDFNRWSSDVFTLQANEWYARLFSHGDEKYTAEDVAEYGRIDVNFYNWLLRRAIEMIDEHRNGRKKNSAPR